MIHYHFVKIKKICTAHHFYLSAINRPPFFTIGMGNNQMAAFKTESYT